MDYETGEATPLLHDPVAFSQHGELVWDSTECVGMNSGVEVARRKRQCATVRGDEPRVIPKSASPHIRARIPQGVQRDVAADEVAREPLGDVESGPAVTAADFQEAAAGGRRQGIAKRVCLFDGRESVQADFMAEDDALNPPRHLASALGVPLPEAVDRVRLSHSFHDTGLSSRSGASPKRTMTSWCPAEILSHDIFDLDDPGEHVVARLERRMSNGNTAATRGIDLMLVRTIADADGGDLFRTDRFRTDRLEEMAQADGSRGP